MPNRLSETVEDAISLGIVFMVREWWQGSQLRQWRERRINYRQDAEVGAIVRLVSYELTHLSYVVHTYRFDGWAEENGLSTDTPRDRAIAVTEYILVRLPKWLQSRSIGNIAVDRYDRPMARWSFHILFGGYEIPLPYAVENWVEKKFG